MAHIGRIVPPRNARVAVRDLLPTTRHGHQGPCWGRRGRRLLHERNVRRIPVRFPRDSDVLRAMPSRSGSCDRGLEPPRRRGAKRWMRVHVRVRRRHTVGQERLGSRVDQSTTVACQFGHDGATRHCKQAHIDAVFRTQNPRGALGVLLPTLHTELVLRRLGQHGIPTHAAGRGIPLHQRRRATSVRNRTCTRAEEHGGARQGRVSGVVRDPTRVTSSCNPRRERRLETSPGNTISLGTVQKSFCINT